MQDSPEIRNDLLDYAYEVGSLTMIVENSRHIESGKMTDNTMIIVTSDNGMAFPYAKAGAQNSVSICHLLLAGKKDRVIKLLEIFWDSLIYLQLFMKLLAFKLRKNTPYPEKFFKLIQTIK